MSTAPATRGHSSQPLLIQSANATTLRLCRLTNKHVPPQYTRGYGPMTELQLSDAERPAAAARFVLVMQYVEAG